MEKTSNFQLNQWSLDDRLRMEDFNADNARIDAALALCGNCGVETGTYVGTGEKGETAPTSLTLQHEPFLLLVAGTARQMLAVYNCDYVQSFYGNDQKGNRFTWNGRTVSWYNENYDSQQLNKAGETYYYYAFYLKGE